MTRKDYQRIAGAIAEQRRLWAGDLSARSAIRGVVEELLPVLANDNPRFDALRFVEACGYALEGDSGLIALALEEAR